MSVAERARAIIADVRFRDWQFVIRDEPVPLLMVAFDAPDTMTGEPTRQYGRMWMLHDGMTDSAIVYTAWKAVEAAVEHEAREDFQYKGRRIIGPHTDVEALWRAARKVDV